MAEAAGGWQGRREADSRFLKEKKERERDKVLDLFSFFLTMELTVVM